MRGKCLGGQGRGEKCIAFMYGSTVAITVLFCGRPTEIVTIAECGGYKC